MMTQQKFNHKTGRCEFTKPRRRSKHRNVKYKTRIKDPMARKKTSPKRKPWVLVSPDDQIQTRKSDRRRAYSGTHKRRSSRIQRKLAKRRRKPSNAYLGVYVGSAPETVETEQKLRKPRSARKHSIRRKKLRRDKDFSKNRFIQPLSDSEVDFLNRSWGYLDKETDFEDDIDSVALEMLQLPNKPKSKETAGRSPFSDDADGQYILERKDSIPRFQRYYTDPLPQPEYFQREAAYASVPAPYLGSEGESMLSGSNSSHRNFNKEERKEQGDMNGTWRKKRESEVNARSDEERVIRNRFNVVKIVRNGDKKQKPTIRKSETNLSPLTVYLTKGSRSIGDESPPNRTVRDGESRNYKKVRTRSQSQRIEKNWKAPPTFPEQLELPNSQPQFVEESRTNNPNPGDTPTYSRMFTPGEEKVDANVSKRDDVFFAGKKSGQRDSPKRRFAGKHRNMVKARGKPIDSGSVSRQSDDEHYVDQEAQELVEWDDINDGSTPDGDKARRGVQRKKQKPKRWNMRSQSSMAESNTTLPPHPLYGTLGKSSDRTDRGDRTSRDEEKATVVQTKGRDKPRGKTPKGKSPRGRSPKKRSPKKIKHEKAASLAFAERINRYSYQIGLREA